jgi:hypothetical protein
VSAPYHAEPDYVSVPCLGIWLQPDRSPPPGPFLPPRHVKARVQFTDRSWRPCEVLAWYAGTNIMIARSRLWYVRLRLLVDGHNQVSEGWFAYNPNYLRPR